MCARNILFESAIGFRVIWVSSQPITKKSLVLVGPFPLVNDAQVKGRSIVLNFLPKETLKGEIVRKFPVPNFD